jgi:hypothetical protein
MRRLGIVAVGLVVVLAVACGGTETVVQCP